jgi:hypothetical protein
MSWRRALLIVAALAGAVTFVPNVAAARGFGRGRGWGGPAIGLGLGLGLGAGYYGRGYYGGYYGGYPVYGGYPAYGGGCWRRTVVYTPYGPRVRRFWVCG